MNNKNDKLNYIKNLIREEVQAELKRKKRFLYEMSGPKPTVTFAQSETGGSLFIKNIGGYKLLNLTDFNMFENGGFNFANKNVPNIEIVIVLSDPSIKLTLKDFMINDDFANKTISIKFNKQLGATGIVNVVHPKNLKINHNLRPASKSRYGY